MRLAVRADTVDIWTLGGGGGGTTKYRDDAYSGTGLLVKKGPLVQCNLPYPGTMRPGVACNYIVVLQEIT